MFKFKEISEKGLVKKCLSGNRKAQEELYTKYAKGMYNVACRIMGNEAEAQDLLQESMVTVFKQLNSYKGDSTLGAWIKRIVVNKCLNELKRRKVDLDYDKEIDTIDENYEGDTVEYKVEKVKKGIQLLPDGYRVILSLYLMEGYDHSEISEILDISVSTSKSQYSRGKKKLLDWINEN